MEEMTIMGNPHATRSIRRCLAALFLLPSLALRAEEIPVAIHGMGWTQVGRIMHASDTVEYDYNGNWFQSASALVEAVASISPEWEGRLGIGAKQVHKAQGTPSSARSVVVTIEPSITQANFTYTLGGDKEASPFRLTLGYFPFNYNPDVRNLGLYLLRGTVYPNTLFSGFELEETIGFANQLGAGIHSTLGAFSHDILLSSETKIRPLFDYSLAYVGKYRPSPAFTLGAGVNFYRLIPIRGELTTPRDRSVFPERFSGTEIQSKYDRNQFYVDPAGGDTVRFSFKGIKVGAFASLDLKALTGKGAMGDEDLKIYSEAALLGVKNYKGIYDDRTKRIPVMFGLNIPVFNALDHLSLEVEWFGMRTRNDYLKLETEYSPIPVGNLTLGRKIDSATGEIVFQNSKRVANQDPNNVENMIRDDWKWSLHGAKTIKNHIRISGQVANDHFRTGGTQFSNTYETAFTTLKDWYLMAKLSYFF